MRAAHASATVELALPGHGWRPPSGGKTRSVSGGSHIICFERIAQAALVETREMLERELRTSDVARVYVLRLPAYRVAAFCACWLLDDELHINTIAVHPDLRRRGLATALMTRLLAIAAAEGACRAMLEVRRSNTAALRLYERMGFHVAGVRRNYYTHPDEDALLLTRLRCLMVRSLHISRSTERQYSKRTGWQTTSERRTVMPVPSRGWRSRFCRTYSFGQASFGSQRGKTSTS